MMFFATIGILAILVVLCGFAAWTVYRAQRVDLDYRQWEARHCEDKKIDDEQQ